MDTFLFCDLFQYELSARGDVRADDAVALVDALSRLPRDCAVTVDFSEVSAIDATAAQALSAAIMEREAAGVEFTVVVGDDGVRDALVAVGVGELPATAAAVGF